MSGVGFSPGDSVRFEVVCGTNPSETLAWKKVRYADVASLERFCSHSHKLVHVRSDEGETIFEFSDGARLRVDMTERGFNGPEAMILVMSSGQMVVWN